jgi:TolB-like protein
VQAVMEGSVFRAGDEMRINVQLVEPSTLRHIWTGTYERNVSDVLAAQEEVVQTVARELGAALTNENTNSGS